MKVRRSARAPHNNTVALLRRWLVVLAPLALFVLAYCLVAWRFRHKMELHAALLSEQHQGSSGASQEQAYNYYLPSFQTTFHGVLLPGTPLSGSSTTQETAAACAAACHVYTSPQTATTDQRGGSGDANRAMASGGASAAGDGSASGVIAGGAAGMSGVCTGWSYCGDRKKCGEQYQVCMLKHVPDITRPDTTHSGPEVGWTSGVVASSVNVSQLLRARGLEPLVTSTLILGLRSTTLTLEVVSPKDDPSFSYSLPLDAPVRDASGPGYHHMGDVTLRVRTAGQQQYTTYSTVSHSTTPVAARRLSAPSPAQLFLSDLKPQLPPGCPVTVHRWLEVPDNGIVHSSVQGIDREGTIDGSMSGNKAGGSGDLKGEHGGRGGGRHSRERKSTWLPGEVHVLFEFRNSAGTDGDSVELGALGLSLPMDQYFINRKLEQVAAQASFVEGYPGGGFGYVQVTRASGRGPVLLILPLPGTSFEAWRPLRGDDRSEQGFGFEGHHELLLHSKAWAENEWRGATQWVPPTSHTLPPGASVRYGYRLLLCPDVRHVEDTLLAAGHPVVIGVPGFTLHADMREGRLLVRTPQGVRLLGWTQEPTGALELEQVTSPMAQPPGTQLLSYRMRVALDATQLPAAAAAGGSSSEGGQGGAGCPLLDPSLWSSCQLGSYERSQVQGGTGSDTAGGAGAGVCPCYTGRVRLRLQFETQGPDSGAKTTTTTATTTTTDTSTGIGTSAGSSGGARVREQVVQLLVVPPARALVDAFGRTSADPAHGWLPAKAGDPWGRGPAFLGYDNELQKKVDAEPRVFMSGLSDEAGASQPLAMALKLLGMPEGDEIQKLEAYVHETLLQAEGQTDGQYIQDRFNHTIRASVFYYKDDPILEKAQPAFIQGCRKSSWWLICWDEARSKETWRAYNYPHVAAVYWSLYRLARLPTPPLATRAPWDWYLRQAVHTSVAMWEYGKGYGKWGLMVGSVFAKILQDVEREGWQQESQQLRAVVKERVAFWQSLTFPFGSEMAWDNTGHEEIYTWLATLGDEAGAEATVGAILAYDALFPHWGLSGSARRWWDYFINGKTNIGNERVLHHYAAPLNAVPLMQHYTRHPDQLFLLRLASAGLMGSVANIKADGGTSMGFHADPSLLRLDGYSADWGVGFYGYATQVTAVITCDPTSLGWLCFNCDIVSADPPLASLHRSADNGCGGRAAVRFEPRDAMRVRAFVAQYALLAHAHGAIIESVGLDTRRSAVTVSVTSEGTRVQVTGAWVELTITRPGWRVVSVRQQSAGQQVHSKNDKHAEAISGGDGLHELHPVNLSQGPAVLMIGLAASSTGT